MSQDHFFRFGLIGWPLGHSLSPVLHQAALTGLGLQGEYRTYPISPLPEGQGELANMLGRFRAGELDGLNVTIPHKQSVAPLLDRLTPLAETVGAVNTIYRKGDQLVGDNTDVPGFLADLSILLSDSVQPGNALILGAGGSARAVAYGLRHSGWQVSIAARRIEQAATLADCFGTAAVLLEPCSLQGSLDNQPPALLVNTTPVGMSPNITASPWPAEIPLPKDAAVYDLVYNPAETALIRAARAAGLPASNGLGMLIEQAALAFERWTALAASREAMRAAVRF